MNENKEILICSMHDTIKGVRVDFPGITPNQFMLLIPSLVSAVIDSALEHYDFDTQDIVDFLISSVGKGLANALGQTKDMRLLAPLMIWGNISDQYFKGEKEDGEETDSCDD